MNGDGQMETPEEALKAVSCGMKLELVPEALKTPELCMEAVRQDGAALEWTPEAFLSEDMAMAAVKSRGDALKLLPERLRTPAVCLEAARRGGLPALEGIPQALYASQKFCRSLALRRPEALRFMPEKARTPAVCLAALKKSPWTWADVPEGSKTAETLAAMLPEHAGSVPPGSVPEALLDEASARILVASSALWFAALPERLQTFELAAKAAAGFSRLFDADAKKACAAFWQSVPESVRPRLAAEAARLGARLESIPESLWTRKILLSCRKGAYPGETVAKWWKDLEDGRKTPEIACAFAGAMADMEYGGRRGGFLASFLGGLPERLKTPETVKACLDAAEPGLGTWLADSGLLASSDPAEAAGESCPPRP